VSAASVSWKASPLSQTSVAPAATVGVGVGVGLGLGVGSGSDMSLPTSAFVDMPPIAALVLLDDAPLPPPEPPTPPFWSSP
jgi:hypothetical protein